MTPLPDAALVAGFALPIMASLAAFAAPRAGAAIAVGACWLNAGLALAMAQMIGAQTDLGGWAPPLGIRLRLDGLAWPFIMLTATAFALTATAAVGRAFLGRPGVAPLWLGLLGGLNALFLSADLFNLYVAIEVVSLAAVALTALGGAAASAPALRYLFVGLGGSVMYLAAVAMLYRATGALDLDLIAASGVTGPALAVPLALASVGLLMKAGLAPFHFWLPPAHAGAAPAASALLSGVVVKAALYVLLRLWTEAAPTAALAAAEPVFRALGVIALGMGAVAALRATRLKALIAASTVAQLGYVSLALGFAAGTPLALKAAVAFILAHGLAKAGVFLAAESLKRGNGHDRLDELTDPGRLLGPAKAAIAMGAVALMGLPPSGGFLAKWTLAEAALGRGHWWMAPLLVAGAVLTGVYMLRLVHATLRTPQRPDGDAPRGWSALTLGALAILAGFSGPLLERLLIGGAP
jgi:formate hydrogenlyase subunit 3/multisubunit Na+/H+ antiporter MnhD subunit